MLFLSDHSQRAKVKFVNFCTMCLLLSVKAHSLVKMERHLLYFIMTKKSESDSVPPADTADSKNTDTKSKEEKILNICVLVWPLHHYTDTLHPAQCWSAVNATTNLAS